METTDITRSFGWDSSEGRDQDEALSQPKVWWVCVYYRLCYISVCVTDCVTHFLFVDINHLCVCVQCMSFDVTYMRA